MRDTIDIRDDSLTCQMEGATRLAAGQIVSRSPP
jgi:hypothetical protein